MIGILKVTTYILNKKVLIQINWLKIWVVSNIKKDKNNNNKNQCLRLLLILRILADSHNKKKKSSLANNKFKIKLLLKGNQCWYKMKMINDLKIKSLTRITLISNIKPHNLILISQ